MVPGHLRRRPAPRASLQLRRRTGRAHLVLHRHHQGRVPRACGQPQVRADGLGSRAAAGSSCAARPTCKTRRTTTWRHAGFEHLVALGESYDGPDDETLTFFSVTEPQAWICDIDGSWNPVLRPKPLFHQLRSRLTRRRGCIPAWRVRRRARLRRTRSPQAPPKPLARMSSAGASAARSARPAAFLPCCACQPRSQPHSRRPLMRMVGLALLPPRHAWPLPQPHAPPERQPAPSHASHGLFLRRVRPIARTRRIAFCMENVPHPKRLGITRGESVNYKRPRSADSATFLIIVCAGQAARLGEATAREPQRIGQSPGPCNWESRGCRNGHGWHTRSAWRRSSRLLHACSSWQVPRTKCANSSRP